MLCISCHLAQPQVRPLLLPHLPAPHSVPITCSVVLLDLKLTNDSLLPVHVLKFGYIYCCVVCFPSARFYHSVFVESYDHSPIGRRVPKYTVYHRYMTLWTIVKANSLR